MTSGGVYREILVKATGKGGMVKIQTPELHPLKRRGRV